jgi:hypothetical protein
MIYLFIAGLILAFLIYLYFTTQKDDVLRADMVCKICGFRKGMLKCPKCRDVWGK